MKLNQLGSLDRHFPPTPWPKPAASGKTLFQERDFWAFPPPVSPARPFGSVPSSDSEIWNGGIVPLQKGLPSWVYHILSLFFGDGDIHIVFCGLMWVLHLFPGPPVHHHLGSASCLPSGWQICVSIALGPNMLQDVSARVTNQPDDSSTTTEARKRAVRSFWDRETFCFSTST